MCVTKNRFRISEPEELPASVACVVSTTLQPLLGTHNTHCVMSYYSVPTNGCLNTLVLIQDTLNSITAVVSLYRVLLLTGT